jgi:sugar/nucleoside kinase (ribokinase family)
MRVASIGECMVEFSAATDGLFARGFGGDTLNTALYLARLGVDTSYVTALGDDPLSDAMLVAWKAEGIKTDEVMCFTRAPSGPLHDRARCTRRTQLSVLARPRAGA